MKIFGPRTPWADGIRPDGADVDVAISTRSSHDENDVRDAILDDATRFSGASIALILANTNNFPILYSTHGDVVTDGTEQNVYIENAPAGVWAPKWCKIDCTNHTVAETIRVKVYYRNASGGAWVLQSNTQYPGLIDPQLLEISLEENRYGLWISIEKEAGNNRTYPYSMYYEA